MILLCAPHELAEGQSRGFKAGGLNLFVVRRQGRLYAYRNRCPHQAWPLHEGDLDGDTLTCARHLWEFDAHTGRGINPDNSHLATYPCKVEDGTIFVELG